MSTQGPLHERPWAPAELDALEDRLEHDDEALPWPSELTAEARDRVRARAQEYRALQQYTRIALEVAPPASVLASVLEQARASCELAPAVAVVEPPRPGLWARLRRVWWIPSLATAGAGALAATLVIRQGEREPAAVAQAPAAQGASKAEAPRESAFELRRDPAIAQAAPEAEPAPDAAARGDGLVAAEKDDFDEGGARRTATELRTKGEAPEPTAAPRGASATPVDDAIAAEADVQLGGEQERKAKRDVKQPSAPKSAPKPSSGAAPPASPVTPPRELPGAAGGGGVDAIAPAEQLARGDEARRRRDCGAARSDYLAVVERGNAKQRARARAGLALCAERSGSEKTAAELLSQARKDDPGIDAWVDAERSR